MKKFANILVATALVAAFTSCTKDHSVMNDVINEHIYVEFGVAPDGSKINYGENDGAFTWSADDALSCYAGDMLNAKFYNKNQTVAQQAKFACADAKDWGTEDFFVMYPYKEEGYTVTENGVTFELPKTLTVGAYDYSNTFMIGCAKDVTPVTLAAQSITMRQVCGIVRVKMPAVEGMRPVTVAISDRNSEENYSKSVTVNCDMVSTYDDDELVRCLIYEIEGGGYNTEAIVNVPVFQKNNSECEITVLYANAENKIRKIYTRQVSTTKFEQNHIYNIGFNGIENCVYEAYDWIQVNPSQSGWSAAAPKYGWNYFDTGLKFDQDYYVTLKVGTESFQYNRWYMGYRWDEWKKGVEIGEYRNDPYLSGTGDDSYCVLHGGNGQVTYYSYEPGLRTFEDVKFYAIEDGGDKNVFLLNRGTDYYGDLGYPEHYNIGITDVCWYSFKCYSLKMWARTGDEKGQILVYYIPTNDKGVYGNTMFDVVSGKMCEVKNAHVDTQTNALTIGNDD